MSSFREASFQKKGPVYVGDQFPFWYRFGYYGAGAFAVGGLAGFILRRNAAAMALGSTAGVFALSSYLFRNSFENNGDLECQIFGKRFEAFSAVNWWVAASLIGAIVAMDRMGTKRGPIVIIPHLVSFFGALAAASNISAYEGSGGKLGFGEKTVLGSF